MKIKYRWTKIPQTIKGNIIYFEEGITIKAHDLLMTKYDGNFTTYHLQPRWFMRCIFWFKKKFLGFKDNISRPEPQHYLVLNEKQNQGIIR
jgi:hypothetical protein